MENQDDIELHDLQTIEDCLRAESPSEREVDAARSSASGFMVGSASGFMVG